MAETLPSCCTLPSDSAAAPRWNALEKNQLPGGGYPCGQDCEHGKTGGIRSPFVILDLLVPLKEKRKREPSNSKGFALPGAAAEPPVAFRCRKHAGRARLHLDT